MARTGQQLSRGAPPATGAVRHEQHHVNLVPYLIPVVSALGLYVVAMLVRGFLASDVYAWYWSVFTAALYSTFAVVAWRASRARGALTCSIVSLGASLGAGWAWWAAGVPGPLGWRAVVVYWGVALLFCACLWLLSGLRHGSAEWDPMAERLRRVLGEVRNVNAVHKTDRGTVQADLHMLPGATLDDLDRKALASALDIPESGVRMQQSPTSAARGSMEIDPASTIVPAEPWSGPSQRYGSSLLLPAIVGAGPAGQPSEWYFIGDAEKDRNLGHVLGVGMNGAGKSAAIRQLLIEGLTRRGFSYVYGNPRKAEQEPDWVLQGAEAVATTNKEVVDLLKWLRDVETPRRVKLLGSSAYKRRHDQWHPDAIDELGLDFMLVLLDEFAAVAQDVERVATDLGETLRSLGVQLAPFMQTASGRRIPTDFRRQLAGRWVFGVATGEDDDMALGDIDEMEGCRPSAWANRMPGMHYLVMPGTDSSLWPVAMRTRRGDKATIDAWGERLVAIRAAERSGVLPVATPAAPRSVATVSAGPSRAVDGGPARPVAAELAVPAQRAVRPTDADGAGVDEIVHDPEDIAISADDADYANGLLDGAFDDPDEDGYDDDPPDDELDELSARPAGGVIDEDDDEVAAELGESGTRPPAAPSRDAGAWRFRREPPAQMAPEQARDFLRAVVLDLARQGVPHLKGDDEVIERVLERTGMSASWLRKHLDRLAEGEGPLLRKRGARLGYDVLPVPARAGA